MNRIRSIALRVALALAVVALVGAVSVAAGQSTEHDVPGVPLADVPGAGSRVVTGTVSSAGEQDNVYSIRLGAGDRFTASVSTSDTAHLGLKLWSPSTTSVDQDAGLIEASDGSTFPLGWTHTAAEDGMYFVDVRAVEGTATFALAYRHERATTVSLSASESVPPGGTVKLTAKATDSMSEKVAEGRVSVYYSFDQASWRLLAVAPIGSDGLARADFTPSQRTYFKARLEAAGDYLVSDYSATIASAPQVSLTAPSAPTTVGSWTAFTSSGYLRPRHTAGANSVILQAFRKENGTWVLARTAQATNSDYSTWTKYTGKISLPGSTGSAWRIRAYAPADSQHAASASAYRYVTVPMIRFKRLAVHAVDLPDALLPFARTEPVRKSGESTAVAMRIIDGIAYDMPLRQAESGYTCLNSYALTQDEWYLIRAKAQADRLILMHRAEGDGWFFPNTFRYEFGSSYGGVLTPPWYSGIAQGAATGFLARLWEVTGDAKYRDAAEHAMESFLVPRRSGHGWITSVDSLGYLRLQEYPGTPWEFVLNGHIEAADGLYDYYRITGDPRALALYQGALTTTLRYTEQFRRPAWISAYSLGAPAQFAQYHARHIKQLLELYAMSGDTRFVRFANEFDTDYPLPSVTGTVTVTPGSYTAFRFSAAGAVAKTRRLAPAHTMKFAVDRRTRIRGRTGYYFRIQGSSYDDWYVKEVAGHVYYRGVVGALRYRPALSTNIRPGTWKLQRVEETGTVTASRTVTLSVPLRVKVEARATVNGIARVFVSSGTWAGYWAPKAAVALP